MKNLEIISTQITVQAKNTVNNNTVDFAWSYLEGQLPSVVNFNVQRGVIGSEQPFTGNNIISGAFYSETEKFDVQNNSFLVGDFDLYQDILNTCKTIVSDIQEKEVLRN